jgi:hypothetical protein
MMTKKSPAFPASSNGRRVRQQGSSLLLEFPYDPDVVHAVRTIPRRRWNKEDKHWICDIKYLPEVIDALSPFGFVIPHDVLAQLDGIRKLRQKADARRKRKARQEKCVERAFRNSREEMAFQPSRNAKLTRRIKKGGVYRKVIERTDFGSTVIGYEAPDRIVIDALASLGYSVDAEGRLVALLRYLFRINAQAKRDPSFYSTAVTRYGKKEHLLREACRLAAKQTRFVWGWKEDPDPPPNGAAWVLYFEAEGKQVSFHTFERGDGPDFPGDWNGVFNQDFPW